MKGETILGRNNGSSTKPSQVTWRKSQENNKLYFDERRVFTSN
jgi:hypothetical protein